jgi:hypothetical protein
MELLRKFNEPTVVYFPLPTYGSGDFNAVPPSFTAGDVDISIDGSSFGQSTNLPVHLGQGSFRLNLVSSELKGSGIVILIQDSPPKIWEDQCILISTFGSVSGRYDFDFDNSNTVYYADINFTIDNSNSRDEYTVGWFKDGVPLSSGSLSSPTLQVIKRADGTDLVSSSSMDYVGSIGIVRSNQSSNRVTLGEAYITQVTAIIDGATRTWRKLFSRDN